MQKLNAKNGCIAYKVTAEDIGKLGGFGVCDNCNRFAAEGYLVPILGDYLCEHCYQDWQSTAQYYPEDAPYESETAKRYERIIGGEK